MPADKTSPVSGSTPKKGRKYFTLDEANRALPYVSRIVAEITEAYRLAMTIQARMERPGQDPESTPREYEATIDRLNGLLSELQHVGVELKDPQTGLLDFPAVHQGREIYLCWRQGESDVGAWHEKDAGFAGRQDVASLHESND